MSDGRHAIDQEQVGWLELGANAFPGVMWSTDTALRLTACHGQELSAISNHPESLCGVSLFELFLTEDIHYPPIAAHRQALTGSMCPVAFTLRTHLSRCRCTVAG